jgi:hypothetical protein
MVIFIALIAFAAVCEYYVAGMVRDTKQLLLHANDSRRAGDYAMAREYSDSAWDKWSSLSKRSSYVLSDLTIVADVTVSLSRVVTLSYGEDSQRFLEESIATILLLEHFIADNNNVLGGVNSP